jgi:NAD(P)H-nitrite reductase large subunit
MRTVEELVARAPDRFDITVIGGEPHPSYNCILLSSVLAGEVAAVQRAQAAGGWLGTNARSQPIIRRCPADDRVPIVRRQSAKKVWQLVADSIAGAGYPSCQAVGRMLAETVIQPSSWYEKHDIHLIAGKRERGQAQRRERNQQTDRRVVEV